MTTANFPNRSNQRARWLVSYSDLMTLLFAVFVVLFTAAQKKSIPARPVQRATLPASGAAIPPSSPSPLNTLQPSSDGATDALFAGLSNVLGPAARTRNMSLRRLPQGIVIRMNEAGSFRTADAIPLLSVRQTVHQVALILGPAHARIRVEGYTDDQAIHTALFRSNWELSTARAQAVLSLLLTEPGLDPANLSVAGYGPYHPIAGNDTEVGRRLNRRVDLVVTSATGD